MSPVQFFLKKKTFYKVEKPKGCVLQSRNSPAVLASPLPRGLLVYQRVPGEERTGTWRTFQRMVRRGLLKRIKRKLHIQFASPAPPLVLRLPAIQQDHGLPESARQEKWVFWIPVFYFTVQVCASSCWPLSHQDQVFQTGPRPLSHPEEKGTAVSLSTTGPKYYKIKVANQWGFTDPPTLDCYKPNA